MQRGDHIQLNFEFLEMQKWIIPRNRVQRVDEKWGHLPSYCVKSQSCVNRMLKITYLCVFCWWKQKNSYSVGKIRKCIWKISFSTFRKCYRLLGSEIPLARYQPLKIQDFRIFCWFGSFFFYIFILNISQAVTPNLLAVPFSQRIQ